MNILLVVLFSIIGGICYRIGGSEDGQRWVREFGQGICAVLSMISLGLIHWILILSFGVCWAESTYFKKKGSDAVWWNWLLVGLVFGLIPLPYCIVTNSHWLGFSIRLMVCPILTMIWQIKLSFIVANWFRKVWHKDVIDEFGRGFISIITLLILLL